MFRFCYRHLDEWKAILTGSTYNEQLTESPLYIIIYIGLSEFKIAKRSYERLRGVGYIIIS
jgi:hypothetical protein